MGSISAAELLLCALYVLEMINCPGEEVEGVSPCMRYEPKRCSMLPAKLYSIGFHIVAAAVVA